MPPIIHLCRIMLSFFSELSDREKHCTFEPDRVPSPRTLPLQEDVMSNQSYVADLQYENLAFARLGRRSGAPLSRWHWRSEPPALRTSAITISPTGAISNRPTTPTSRPTPRSFRPRSPAISRKVLVGDNQPVKAGQVLARIDDRDFRTALDQARRTSPVPKPRCATSMRRLALQQPIIEQRRPMSPPLRRI